MTEQVNPLADLDVEQELTNALNKEIARELMTNRIKDITEAELNALLQQCDGNAWDVPIMHELQKHIALAMKKE